MDAETAQVDDLRLVALPSAVNCAELFARFALAEWHLRPMAEDASDVARELVSASVRRATPKAPELLTLRLRLRGDALVTEVEDRTPGQPPVVPPALSHLRSGALRLDDGRTNLVWCELPLPTGIAASSVPLPRRERRRSPAAEQLADEPVGVDPEVMERILYGLGRHTESPDR